MPKLSSHSHKAPKPVYFSENILDVLTPDVVSLAAYGAWARCVSWSFAYDTRGIIPKSVVKVISPRIKTCRGYKELFRETADGTTWELLHFGTLVFRTRPDERLKIPTAIRAAVYERDGYSCVSCSAEENLTLDHIYPWSLGGNDTIENLQTMCQPCNSSKGARVE